MLILLQLLHSFILLTYPWGNHAFQPLSRRAKAPGKHSWTVKFPRRIAKNGVTTTTTTTFPLLPSSSKTCRPQEESSTVVSAVKIDDWSKVEAPSSAGGGNYGPNWTLDPKTLKPKSVTGRCGTLSWAVGKTKDGQPSVFPERRMDLPVGQWLAKRPNLGVCMSGGGLRAAVCALGWLRGLHHLNILPKTRYFAANSGGTWTSLPLFSRQILDKKELDRDMDYDYWLGKYVPPNQITMDTTTELGQVGQVLKSANLNDITATKDNQNVYTVWNDLINRDFFTPIIGDNRPADFWLDACNAYLWNQDNARIKNILNDRNTLPYPIYVACCSSDITNHQIYPFEMTPMYTGIPVDPKTLNPDETDIGGGFIMGSAINARASAPDSMDQDDDSPVPVDNSAHYLKNLELPSPVVKLFELTGASSNFGAATDAMTKTNLKFLPGLSWLVKSLGAVQAGTYQFWSPNKGQEPGKIELVDGGLLDNLGALALLRRRVSTLIICNANDGDLTKLKKEDWVNAFYDVAALFGLKGSTLPWFMRWLAKSSYGNTVAQRSQVFETSGFEPLLLDIIAKIEAGKPAVKRQTMHVMPNPQAGIYEGFSVDVIWVFNCDNKTWREAMSNQNVVEKINQLRQGKKGFLGMGAESPFPYFSTLSMQFSEDQTNALAHFCSYSIVEGLKEVGFDISKVPL
ncbi:hypothetical protein ACA910_003655 [Epithemia clementina (nom. ined.)]